ncbi:hypothetical protein ACFQY7_37895 [Actinomadura luteofluorescens]
MTVPRLAKKIRRAVRDQGMADQASVLGQRIRDEDGVGRAQEIIDSLL